MNIPQDSLSADLPTALTTPVLAHLVGLSQPTIRTAARAGGLRLGGGVVQAIMTETRIVWPAAPVIEALGLDAEQAARAVEAAQRRVGAENRRRMERARRAAA